MHFGWAQDGDWAMNGFDCQLTKLNGTLRDMQCSWPATKVFSGILGQIQINAKLKIKERHSDHPLSMAIRAIVENVLNTALQS